MAPAQDLDFSAANTQKERIGLEPPAPVETDIEFTPAPEFLGAKKGYIYTRKNKVWDTTKILLSPT